MRTLPRLVAIGSTLILGLTAAATTTGAAAATRTTTATTTSTDTTAAAPAAGTPYVPPPLVWGTCESATLQRFGAECSMLTVPLDYANPQGTKIQLAVSRVRHTTSPANYQGIMLVNPGGPGGSGLVYSIFQTFVPKKAGNAYDWVGFDPRGVGSSVPALTCDGDYNQYNRPDYVPSKPSVLRAWFHRTNQYARDCAAAGGLLLEHVRTTDSVGDLESIRIALGQQKINFYGFSYGTYLAQVYATLHPDRVRRFVLDGTIDARKVFYQSNLDQDVAFDDNMPVFYAWVASHDDVYHLGTSAAAIEKTYYRVYNQLRTQPADGGRVGPDEWNDVLLSAGYYVFGWADLATAFSRAVNDGDFSLIRATFGGPGGPGSDNGYAMYLATECTDAPWPTAWPRWATDNWTLYGTHPFLTWGNAWFNAPCRTWAAKPGPRVTVTDRGVAPMLIVNETNDAATPYAGALYTRSVFTRSVLVEGVGGTTHAGSLSGIACVDNTIADYLKTGALPARVPGNRSDKQCRPVPPPPATLTGAAAVAAGAGAAKVDAATDLAALRRALQPTVR